MQGTYSKIVAHRLVFDSIVVFMLVVSGYDNLFGALALLLGRSLFVVVVASVGSGGGGGGFLGALFGRGSALALRSGGAGGGFWLISYESNDRSLTKARCTREVDKASWQPTSKGTKRTNAQTQKWRKRKNIPPPSPSARTGTGGARLASFFLMVPQVLEAVLVVLKSAATLSFSMSISGGDLRQCQAALRTFSSFSVKKGFSAVAAACCCCCFAGDADLMGEEDMVLFLVVLVWGWLVEAETMSSREQGGFTCWARMGGSGKGGVGYGWKVGRWEWESEEEEEGNEGRVGR